MDYRNIMLVALSFHLYSSWSWNIMELLLILRNMFIQMQYVHSNHIKGIFGYKQLIVVEIQKFQFAEIWIFSHVWPYVHMIANQCRSLQSASLLICVLVLCFFSYLHNVLIELIFHQIFVTIEVWAFSEFSIAQHREVRWK